MFVYKTLAMVTSDNSFLLITPLVWTQSMQCLREILDHATISDWAERNMWRPSGSICIQIMKEYTLCIIVSRGLKV